MIQFDKKISIDGVAVIITAVAVVVWLTTINNTLASQNAELSRHEAAIQKVEDTEQLLQQNLAVLTAIQNVQGQNRQPQTTVIK